MEELKFNVNQNNVSPRVDLLDLCSAKYDPSDSLINYYDRFKFIVCNSLKRKGFVIGDEQLLQDEILSPTFEEVLILWCLDKIHPNLSNKIKSAFNPQLNAGVSIKELKDDIFNYFSGKEFMDEIQEKSSNPLKCKDCNRQIVTKPDPEANNTEANTDHVNGEDICIKQEDIETLLYVEDRVNVKGEKTDDYQELEDEYGDNSMDADDSENNDIQESKADKDLMLYSDGDNSDDNYDENFEDDSWQPENNKDDVDKKPMKRNRNGPANKYNKPTKCEICGRKCAGERRLQEHIDRKHNKIFKCKKCEETFQGWETLKEHNRSVHRPSSVKPVQVVCDTCGKSVAGKRRLVEHIQRKHNSIFSCKACDKQFKSIDELKLHRIKAHKPVIKPQMCPHCGKIIKSYGMKRHILTHISDITCKICREKFLTQEELDAHTKRHEENPNYRILKKRNIQCETCKRAFANAEEYGLHMCKHYGCDICEESFMTKRNLEIHKRYHNGEPIFSCDLCEALFVNRKALYCHKRAAHDPDKKKYKCDECGKAFLNPCHLERHKNTHVSDKPYKCDICHKGFKQKSGLKNHMHSHTGALPFPCVSCDMRFRTSIKMKQHRESGKCGMKTEEMLPATKIES